MTNTILENLQRAKDVKPVYEQNGIKVVSFEEQRALAQADMVNGDTIGNRLVNNDGTVGRSRTAYAAINTDYLYLNRYKKSGKSLYVVIDYRAIKEQETGRVYLKQIPAYVIVRGDDGELKLSKTVMISDAEFISDYTHMLTPSAMSQITPLLTEGTEITADEISI